jgi:hypothetical protein
MHLVIQAVHVPPCGNSAMKVNKGTNRILYHYIAAQTITEPPPCFTVGTRQALLIVGFLRCSNINSFWCREQREGRLIWPYHAFTIVWSPGFMVVTSSFTHLGITSIIRGLAIAAPSWVLDLWSSRRTVFSENSVFKMNIQFFYSVTCSAIFLRFFETIPLNVRRSLSVNVDFRPLFLLVDVVFPWFV